MRLRYDKFMVTAWTLVTLTELDTNTFPITFSESCGVIDPMFAVWRKALAKRREGPPRPAVPVVAGTMIPAVDMYDRVSVRNVFCWWVTVFWNMAKLVTFADHMLAVNMLAVL